jgi:hypothetical protein
MRRSYPRIVLVAFITLLLAAGLPPGGPVAAQELAPPSAVEYAAPAATTDLKLEKVGKWYIAYSQQLAVGKDGVPVVSYREQGNVVKIVRRTGGQWVDLKLPILCSYWDRVHVDSALAVDDQGNVHFVHICVGKNLDDIRYARYDKAKQEWELEVIDSAGWLYGNIQGPSLTILYSWKPAVSYVVDTKEVRYAERNGPDEWAVEKMPVVGDSVHSTQVGHLDSVAYQYSKDGTGYVAAVQKRADKPGWLSTTVAEGSLLSRNNRSGCLGFRRSDAAFFAYRESGGIAYAYEFVLDKFTGSRVDVSDGCDGASFAFVRNDALVLARLFLATKTDAQERKYEIGTAVVLRETRRALVDYVRSGDRHYVLLRDNADGWLYFGSGDASVFTITRRLRIRPEGGGIYHNNERVADGTNAPVVASDKVVASPSVVKRISYNAECAQGFVEMVALQVRPHLPEDLQHLSDTRIAFMILLSNPKLADLLEEVCKEEAPQAVAANVAAEDPYLLLDMESGAMQVSSRHADFILDVRTPQAVCRTAGGSAAAIAHDADSNRSFFHVTAGQAVVTPADTQYPPFTLKAGKAAEITPSGIKKQNIAPPCYLPYIGG